jgi:8-oxo-dGTP pyrophosphatase MutT (NUDIX family)
MPVETMLPDNQPVPVTDFRIDTSGQLPVLFAEEAEQVREGWDRRTAANPHLFNGAVYLTGDMKLEGGVISGSAARLDYANFLHWRGNVPFQDAIDLHHIFAAAAIESADGKLIAVRASATTVNAGKVYFAGGSFDDDDVAEGMLDPRRNMAREVREETGLELSAMTEREGWIAVRNNRFVAVYKLYRSRVTSADIKKSIFANLARQDLAENDQVVLIGNAGDISADMPKHMQAYCRHFFTAS